MQLMAMMYEVYRPSEDRAVKALKAVAAVEPMFNRERSMTMTIGSHSAFVGTWCLASI